MIFLINTLELARTMKVLSEAYERIAIEIDPEKICKPSLNGKNTIKAINEYALSVINYHVGAILLEYADYLMIDDEVRKMLVKYKVNTER